MTVPLPCLYTARVWRIAIVPTLLQLIIMLVMPKMMANMDPEQLKEMQQMQAAARGFALLQIGYGLRHHA